MDVKPHNTPEELRELIANSNELSPLVVRRYRGVLMAMEEHSLRQIAEELDVNINSALAWVQQYNENGIPGLLGKVLASPMRGYSKEVVTEGIKGFISENQGRVSLEDITDFIKENYNRDATEGSVYPVIRKLGFFSETIWTHKSLSSHRNR